MTLWEKESLNDREKIHCKCVVLPPPRSNYYVFSFESMLALVHLFFDIMINLSVISKLRFSDEVTAWRASLHGTFFK